MRDREGKRGGKKLTVMCVFKRDKFNETAQDTNQIKSIYLNNILVII